MKRRDFVAGGTAAAAGLAGAAPGARASSGAAGGSPNILFILVDELRFPSAFPQNIGSADDYIRTFMPNLYRLWRFGVVFTNHFTAGVACTPARGCLITGLYTQQSWLVQTILAKPYHQFAIQPVLSTAYPTYGKLLRRAGYQTPYAGKWHVSIPGPGPLALDGYGFDATTYYDPTGANLQGTVGDQTHGYLSDKVISQQAVGWLAARTAHERPWCLTVSFINPHDKEFFWAGTEFKRYNDLFMGQSTYRPFNYYSTVTADGTEYYPLVPWQDNPLKTVPPLPQTPFPALPPNWESTATIKAHKPSTQLYAKLFSEAVWGGASDDAGQTEFSIAPYPPIPSVPGELPYGIGLAPYHYWHRGQDAYVQIMGIVDQRIGEVLDALDALPTNVRDNTVVVFTSDHGEYAGAHGYLSGKLGSVYNEAYHVPLVVYDPTGRFAARPDVPRAGLSSSVDLLRLLVTIGNNGSDAWLSGDNGTIYGPRLDMVAMLQSPAAPGRPFVLLATDEAVPGYYNFNQSPQHVVGMRTDDLKLGIYCNWAGVTDRIVDDHTLEAEFYDYGTQAGVLELDNRRHDPRIPRLKRQLLDSAVPDELRAPLPGSLRQAQLVAKAQYLAYDALIRNMTPSQIGRGQLRTKLGYGADF